jgi:hypothetical protein
MVELPERSWAKLLHLLASLNFIIVIRVLWHDGNGDE